MRAPLPLWLRAAAALTAVGWGANQFAALLGEYRHELSATETTGLFGAYALGLMPALLIAAPISDRRGRRPLLRITLLLSLTASIVLLLGHGSFPMLLVGRLLAGVAAGAAFGPGTAWVKELSAAAGSGPAGARRAAIALTAGFAAGPFVAGLIAQWAPLPEILPYGAHLVVAIAAALLAWRVPETVVPRERAGAERGGVWRAVLSRPFLAQVLPTAPWVFGAASTALAVLPSLLVVGGYGELLSGVTAAVTLGCGILVQGPARRLLARGRRLAFAVGIGVLVAGLLLAAVIAATRSVLLLLPAALLLGAAYGILLISGLSVVEDLAAPDVLATVTGIFYCLTYVGFGYPLLVAALSGPLPAWAVLAGSAVVAMIGWVTVGAVRARRP